MCFHLVMKDKNLRPLTAKKNIICYKVVYLFRGTKILSSIRDYLYTLNKRNREIKLYAFFSSYTGETTVDAGYHSYRSLGIARRTIAGCSMYKVAECVIPRGAKYYQRKRPGEYVSSTIIMKKIL